MGYRILMGIMFVVPAIRPLCAPAVQSCVARLSTSGSEAGSTVTPLGRSLPSPSHGEQVVLGWVAGPSRAAANRTRNRGRDMKKTAFGRKRFPLVWKLHASHVGAPSACSAHASERFPTPREGWYSFPDPAAARRYRATGGHRVVYSAECAAPT